MNERSLFRFNDNAFYWAKAKKKANAQMDIRFYIVKSVFYKIVPLIFKETMGVLSAFEFTVMVFRMGPTRLVSYFT